MKRQNSDDMPHPSCAVARGRFLFLALATTALATPAAAGPPEAAPEVPADAPDEPDEPDEGVAAARELEASLHYQTGAITLPCGKAAVALPEGYRYLDRADTDRVLQWWGNPPDPGTEGMIVPPDGLFGEDGWAIVMEYSDDGHVDDADAASIDYDALLAQMKRGVIATNRERERLGLSTAELIGWAEPPHYDQQTRKLYWAKEIAFAELDETTLNYAVRVLGREGVLELNAVATTRQLARVAPTMTQVLGFSDFTDGNRYTDYQPGTDRDAGYGIAALVAGGAVATKFVASKGFWAALIAAKKLLLAIAVAIGAAVKAMWSRLRRLGGNTRDA
jgi:uncharacterized membrane-anchored protein